jgi:FAD/FMN-containing dehydrogenase
MLWSRGDPLPLPEAGTALPYGRGRSYGDSCLNADGVVLATQHLDRFIAFDAESGTIRCEAGATLGEIIDLCLPKGWFLPVVPGTQHVSVGGAIANDVHGKNHHRAGSFGHHVVCFELARSDGRRMLCSPDENADWFRATIGGLGLTGLITWAELRLKRVRSALVETEDIPFASLDEFAALSTASDAEFEYTVAWFDCYSYSDRRLSGIFSRGRHVEEEDGTLSSPRPVPRLSAHFDMPEWLLHPRVVRAFNKVYYEAARRRGRRRVRLESFLFPLDAIQHWNRLYGRRGFMQLQCLFPDATSATGLEQLLQTISLGRQGSFLAVLKRFGARASPGLLSFPGPGSTVALDFPNRGDSTRALIGECHSIVARCGGRIYPAKDATMSVPIFAATMPKWREITPFVDPRFSSSFWRRTAMAIASQET